jgi:hypothetical protein
MKRTSIFAAILAVFLFGGPMMACVVPDAQLTPEEKQCCKEMGRNCQPDQSGMPMSHSCCKTTVQPRNDFRPSSTISAPVPVLVVAPYSKPPIEFLSPDQSIEHALWLRQSHSPPGEATDALSPLRI